MFKVFRNHLFSFFLPVFILFFIQTVEGYTNFLKGQFQEERAVSVVLSAKGTVPEVLDSALIRDVNETNTSTFDDVDEIPLFVLLGCSVLAGTYSLVGFIMGVFLFLYDTMSVFSTGI